MPEAFDEDGLLDDDVDSLDEEEVDFVEDDFEGMDDGDDG